jgi:creatinine amidohydrolase
MKTLVVTVISLMPLAGGAHAQAQTNPLWHEQKTRNYLPHMSWPEVQDLLARTDMVIIPVASLEQHARHLPIGADFLRL